MCKSLLIFHVCLYLVLFLRYSALNPDLDIWVKGLAKSLEIVRFDRPYTAYCWFAIVSISLSCTIFELFDIEYYRDLEIWVRDHSRTLKMVPFESLISFLFASIATMAVCLAISESLVALALSHCLRGV